MSEFDGLWQQQNNPACTKSVGLRVFIMLKLDPVQKENDLNHFSSYSSINDFNLLAN